MGIPLIQQARVGGYILKQHITGVKRYPLVLMLEPLFRCNLACAGCGKIQFPKHILDLRLGVDECLDAVDECGAPIVSIPGGEPLIHPEIGDIVAGITRRKKFVYLCTNALLLEKKLHRFEPSSYLTFSIHLDGMRETHDDSVNCSWVGMTVNPNRDETSGVRGAPNARKRSSGCLYFGCREPIE